ncbi:MAG TPA: Rne/Rng family ribonuclease [Candidatus Obscuribacterales bacterium]
MKKSLIISEQDNIGAILENERVVEFFVNRGELLLGDIYTAVVENILPGIDAAFVNLGKDKMGFLHANDVPGQGPLKERLVPKQKLLVQITKEPTGHKGPRVSTAISLPGRFLVLVPEERGVSISRRISEARERARLKSVVNLMKPPGVGLIIRTEAKGQNENELFEDFELLWDRWQTVVSEAEAAIGPALIYRDQDLLYRVIRDAYSHDVAEIIVDSPDGQRRAQEYLEGWASKNTKVFHHPGEDNMLVAKGVDKEIEAALSDRVELPSGGHLNIQPTEALTVIDVNSGRFTSSRTQAETVRRTNLEAAQEISRQLRLRNIGGMVIVDFIDMDSRKDQQQVLEIFQRALEEDRAKPQIGQLSDLGLVELTRRRQGQSLRELFTVHCASCQGMGVVPTLEIGPLHDRKVITFKPHEEEVVNKGKSSARRGSKPQGAVLKAASVMSGRVLPTVEEVSPFDEGLEFVPEEILEQVPDDLLDERHSKTALKHGAFADEGAVEEGLEEAELIDADSEDMTVELQTESFAPPTSLFEESLIEDDESSLGELDENISAVERVFHELDNPRPQASPQANAVEEPETFVVIGSEAALSSEQAPYQATIQEEEEEELGDYETEVDPITGIYRLKPRVKEVQEEGSAVRSDAGVESWTTSNQSESTIESRDEETSSGWRDDQSEAESQPTELQTASGFEGSFQEEESLEDEGKADAGPTEASDERTEEEYDSFRQLKLNVPSDMHSEPMPVNHTLGEGGGEQRTEFGRETGEE